MAGLAGGGALVLAQLLAHPGALGLEHAAVEIADHAVERLLDLVALAAVDEAQGDRAALGAVEDDVVDLLGQVLPRRLEAEAELAGEAAEHLHVIRAGRVGARPGDDRALLDRERLVGDDQLGIEQLLLAEPVAARAGALRRVEAEQARLDLGDGEAGDRAGEFLGEGDAALRGRCRARTARSCASSSALATPVRAVEASASADSAARAVLDPRRERPRRLVHRRGGGCDPPDRDRPGRRRASAPAPG